MFGPTRVGLVMGKTSAWTGRSARGRTHHAIAWIHDMEDPDDATGQVRRGRLDLTEEVPPPADYAACAHTSSVT